ncbi:MAG: hypothetical protein H0U84_05050 [Thermoleophilaceae bacterium]|nr:hypothetical protein [Thermoleophilaceae bacterium]
MAAPTIRSRLCLRLWRARTWRRVDAYVGRTRCGMSSVRRTGSFAGFIIDVAGPDSVPGCARGATITFRVDGRRALDTAVNEPGRSGSRDLTLP